MRSQSTFLPLLTGLALLLALPGPGSAQSEGGQLGAATLKREHPEMYDILLRVERAHGVLFGQLMAEGDAVRASGEDLPTFGFEFDMVDRLTQLVQQEGPADDVAEESAAGFAALGERAAGIIAWGNAFYRDVMGILADPAVKTVPERRAALAEAVERYKSRPDVALPVEPKSMDILYEHRHHERFRTGYNDLDGLIWSGHWLKLAASEPLTDFPEWEKRQEGLDTVITRYYAKLSYGEPPQFFPSELPLRWRRPLVRSPLAAGRLPVRSMPRRWLPRRVRPLLPRRPLRRLRIHPTRSRPPPSPRPTSVGWRCHPPGRRSPSACGRLRHPVSR